MKPYQLRALLTEARDEIRMLRRSNEIMGAQLEIVQIFDRAISATVTYPTQGYGEDVAHKLDKAAADIDVDAE